MDKLENKVDRNEFDNGMGGLETKLDSKLTGAITDFQEQINRMIKKSDKRLAETELKLKDVEANTLWKIKDYEKLLEARPTIAYVKSAM